MATSSFMGCGLNSLHKLSCQRFDILSTSTTTTTTTTTTNTATAAAGLSLSNSVARRSLSPSGRRYLCSGDRPSRSKMEFVVYGGDQVADLLPSVVHLPENWSAWLPGVILAVVLPFFTTKRGPFGKLKAELDKVEEAVDNVADRVEEIAEKVEEFVGDISEDLPEGSQFRQTLEKVEMVADTIGKDAKMVSDIVDKMDEMEAKLETMLHKVVEKKESTSTEVEQ